MENNLIRPPYMLLDEDGYPTDEWLAFLRNYDPETCIPVQELVVDYLPNGWNHRDWGYKLHRRYREKRRLELHTGGWSGNEEVIRAILDNFWLTDFKLRYVMWKTGGHYYFELAWLDDELFVHNILAFILNAQRD